MSRFLFRLGHFGGRHPWRVLAAWVLIVAAAILANGWIGGGSSETFRLPGAESQRASDALEERFPEQSVNNGNIVFHSEEGLNRPEAQAEISEALSHVAEMPIVASVSDPFDARGPTLSADGQTAFATVALSVNKLEPAEFEEVEEATESAREAGLQVEYDGLLGDAEPESEPPSELIGIAVAIVVLAIAFGSLVAMSLPLVAALVGLVVGISGIGIMSGMLTVPEITLIVGMMMGLGVGIDYALFILARHRQNLARGMAVPDAVGHANATAGMSVLFAGVTVIVAIAGLQVSGIPMLTTIGWGSAVMVAVTMIGAVTLLPALLGVVGRRLNGLPVPFVTQKPADDPNSWSARWSAKVVAKPLRYGLTAAVLLGVIASPVFALRVGFSDAGNEPTSSTMRQSYDLLSEGFGPGFNGQFQIVIDGGDEAAISSVGTALKTTPGIASVTPPATSADGGLTVFNAAPTTSPQEEETSALLTTLRQDVLPDAIEGHEGEVMVTGGTAFESDVSDRLRDRMLLFIGAVIGLSFIALMIVFRSILVPLKAAVLNLISIGAAYGLLVAVFQWGWGAELIGVHETVPIMPVAPMLMFAILFGLSMDYEVFLLSRVREQYLLHRDPKRAVVEGTGSTARIITSAALIMISVFFAFVLSTDVTTKLFGVGLGVAVLLDVTLVRMILVPAAMSLLGHRAWWLPAWLDRILPTIDLEGGVEEDAHAPAAAPAQEEPEDDREPVLI